MVATCSLSCVLLLTSASVGSSLSLKRGGTALYGQSVSMGSLEGAVSADVNQAFMRAMGKERHIYCPLGNKYKNWCEESVETELSLNPSGDAILYLKSYGGTAAGIWSLNATFSGSWAEQFAGHYEVKLAKVAMIQDVIVGNIHWTSTLYSQQLSPPTSIASTLDGHKLFLRGPASMCSSEQGLVPRNEWNAGALALGCQMNQTLLTVV